jgi:hypothetical protein
LFGADGGGGLGWCGGVGGIARSVVVRARGNDEQRGGDGTSATQYAEPH